MEPVDIFLELFTVQSNIAFVFPILACLVVHQRFQAFLWTVVGIMSFLYHLCEIEIGVCVMSLDRLKRWDHIFSATISTVICFECVYMFTKIKRYIEIIVLTISLLVNIVLVNFVFGYIGVPHSIYLACYSTVLVLVLVIIGLIKVGKKEKGKTRKKLITNLDNSLKTIFNRLTNKAFYISGLVCLGGALLLFFMPSLITRELYDATHSFWHIFSSIGVSLILLSMREYLIEWSRQRKIRMSSRFVKIFV